MFLEIPDPTGGLLSGAIEVGEAVFGGGGGDAAAGGAAAAADGGAAAATGVGIGWGTGVSLTGAPILGGLTGSPMEVARALGAASAGAAQSAAGGAVIAGSAGIVTSIPFLATDPIGVLNSPDYYETGQGGSLGDPGIGGRNRPGGYYQGDAPSKQADGPIGQKKQFLTGSQSKLSTLATASPFKLLGKPTPKNDSSSTQNQPGGSNANSNASGTSSTSTPSTKSTNGSGLGSLLSNLSSSLGSGSGSDSASGAGGGDSAGATPASTVAASPTDSAPALTAPAKMPAAITAPTGIDLVLEDVKLAAPASLVAGPAYTVTFRNQGTATAGKFQVAVLAGLDGKLTEDAPRAFVDVSSTAAGEAKEVTLRLPQSALKLTGVDGNPQETSHDCTRSTGPHLQRRLPERGS